MDAIPVDLKRAIGIGIGLFIALIGLVNGGVVVLGTDPTPVQLNADLSSLRILVFVVGLMLAAILVTRRIKGGC